MNIAVQRQNYDDLSTQGEMLINGSHFAWTLEPRKDQTQGKPYCIPAGTYTIKLQWSQHFNMIVPCVQDVPGFTAVEIHPGNFPRDTHACCLLGEIESPDFVGQSRVAFDKLVTMLNGSTEQITITYVG